MLFPGGFCDVFEHGFYSKGLTWVGVGTPKGFDPKAQGKRRVATRHPGLRVTPTRPDAKGVEDTLDSMRPCDRPYLDDSFCDAVGVECSFRTIPRVAVRRLG